jgi:hypothetical protein
MFIINISTFITGIAFEKDNYHRYDLREPPRKIIHPDNIKTISSEHVTDDWSHIPFYPTLEKKNEMIQKYGKNDAEKIIQYSYENSNDPTREIVPPSFQENVGQTVFKNIQEYNNAMKLAKLEQQRINAQKSRVNTKPRAIPQNINKFSPAYARIIGAKSKATTSANIRLGGVYR